MTAETIERLSCSVQTYAWGKIGSQSKVASLARNATYNESLINETSPYAELWMGTHPSSPSYLFSSEKKLLKEILTKSTISPKIYEEFGGDLPFLFKVLSINKALSIQAHPDLELAKVLHKDKPDIYKDPNHKPEIAIALTKFEALCGFKPLEEICINLKEYPEMLELLGETAQEFVSFVDQFCILKRSRRLSSGYPDEQNDEKEKLALQKLFSCLMNSQEEKLKFAIQKIISRIKPMDYSRGSNEELFIRLNSQFPGDVGIFCVLLMNYVNLEPGEAIFLAANEPHAYISGDCVECMATSDNVVRSGLTPKFKDVEVLVNMLTYNSYTPSNVILKGSKYGTYSIQYLPPIKEFAVIKSTLLQGQEENFCLKSPSILLVVDGTIDIKSNNGVVTAEYGHVYFIGSNVKFSITSRTSSNSFLAFCQI
jgi:mannose-6-phosphate isomerase